MEVRQPDSNSESRIERRLGGSLRANDLFRANPLGAVLPRLAWNRAVVGWKVCHVRMQYDIKLTAQAAVLFVRLPLPKDYGFAAAVRARYKTMISAIAILALSCVVIVGFLQGRPRTWKARAAASGQRCRAARIAHPVSPQSRQ